MRKLTFYCFLAALCFYNSVAAREKPRQYYIGDQLPMMQIQPLHGAAPVVLGPHATSPVLIDFFASYCGPCVASLPKLDSLANLFGERLTILVVSHQKPEQLQTFFAKYPALAHGRLRWIAADTLLGKYFPHTMIPHEVWLDANGQVKAITGHEEVAEEALRLLIKGQPLQLASKADIMEFERSRVLFSYSPEWNTSAVVYGSYFTKVLPGAPGGSGFYETNQLRRLYMVNAPIWRHFEVAWQVRPGYVLQLADTTAGISFPKDSLYCYEQLVPLQQGRELMLQRMQADLEQFTGFSARALKAPAGSHYTIPDTLLLRARSSFFTTQNNQK